MDQSLGLEALRVRERRGPRMPNEIGAHLQERIIAFSLGDGAGPRPEFRCPSIQESVVNV